MYLCGRMKNLFQKCLCVLTDYIYLARKKPSESTKIQGLPDYFLNLISFPSGWNISPLLRNSCCFITPLRVPSKMGSFVLEEVTTKCLLVLLPYDPLRTDICHFYL